MAKKNLTIDELGRMIQRGFDGMDERFDSVEETFKKHAIMLIDHTERLKRIEKRLEGIVYRREFEELETRVKMLEELLTVKKGK